MGKRYPFSNRYVFAKVMQDNPDLCKEMIERILDVRIERLESIQVESESAAITQRGVRFDVFVQSDSAAFEVEMQTYEQKQLPLRMRYYRSQLDRRLLDKGDAFAELKPVYVIFICTEDPFGYGLPVYTFESTCKEDPAVPFDNGAVDIVLNSEGDLSQASPAIADLLQYVETNTAGGDGSLTARLASAVDEAHADEEWMRHVNWLEWDIKDARDYAAKEGRAEGREEGRAEDRARFDALLEKMRASGLSGDDIVADLATRDRDDLYRQYGIE